MAGVSVNSKTVAAAITPEALTATSTPCSAVIVYAKAANTGVVYIVDTVTVAQKFPVDGLKPREWLTIPVSNVAAVKVAVSVNGEGVDWLAV